jgi:hypothetical protein
MLTACQPTPENQIVIQKDNFEKLTDTTSVPTNIQEENTKADSANDGKTHVVWNDNKSKTSETTLGEITIETLISVDAMVDLTTKKASIYTVEPVSFELPFIKNTVSYFFGDDYYSPERTKDDYLSQILPLENALPKINSKSRQPAEVSVERWKEKYQTAPENNKRIELKINSGYFDYSCVKGYPYNGAISELYVQNGGMSDTLMYYYVDDINKG